MQIAILAGGLATRLRPLTEKIPKSMITIDGKPFIDYQLRLFAANGITDVVLCVGYLSEQIEEYIEDGKRYGINIVYSTDGESLLGTAGALKNAQRYLSEKFFVLYGDSYVFVNFRDVLSYFSRFDKSALMMVYKNYDKYDRSNVIVKNGLIERYDKKMTHENMIYIDYGVNLLNKYVLDKIPENRSYSLEQLYSELIRDEDMLAYETNKRFYEIGSQKGLKDFEEYILLTKGRI